MQVEQQIKTLSAWNAMKFNSLKVSYKLFSNLGIWSIVYRKELKIWQW